MPDEPAYKEVTTRPTQPTSCNPFHVILCPMGRTGNDWPHEGDLSYCVCGGAWQRHLNQWIKMP
jgi:hypothetical protein